MPRPFLKTRAKETRSTARPRQVQGQVDVPFMLLTVLLVVIGLIMLLSASYPSAYYDLKGNTGGDPFYYFKRQAVYALLGFGIMYLVSRLNYQGLRGLAVTILVVACLLMLAVKIPGRRHPVAEIPGAVAALRAGQNGAHPLLCLPAVPKGPAHPLELPAEHRRGPVWQLSGAHRLF